jgi:hypothetical protein
MPLQKIDEDREQGPLAMRGAILAQRDALLASRISCVAQPLARLA